MPSGRFPKKSALLEAQEEGPGLLTFPAFILARTFTRKWIWLTSVKTESPINILRTVIQSPNLHRILDPVDSAKAKWLGNI